MDDKPKVDNDPPYNKLPNILRARLDTNAYPDDDDQNPKADPVAPPLDNKGRDERPNQLPRERSRGGVRRPRSRESELTRCRLFAELPDEGRDALHAPEGGRLVAEDDVDERRDHPGGEERPRHLAEDVPYRVHLAVDSVHVGFGSGP